MTKLVNELAQHALQTHPNQAASVLERLPESEICRILQSAPVENAANVIERLSPNVAPSVLTGIEVGKAARILEALPIDSATRLVRRIDEERQEAILARVDPARVRSLRAVLRFRPGSAGSLMDPDVLALPCDLSTREALQRIKQDPTLARYNVYVVGEAQKLVGAVNLRELLLAPGRTPLSDLMTRDPHRIPASADRASVLTHPGWKEVHSLPVVDEADAFLGAIRYRVLRRLEEEFMAPRDADADAGAAFGQVIAAGARGLIDAVSGAPDDRQGGPSRGAEDRS